MKREIRPAWIARVVTLSTLVVTTSASARGESRESGGDSIERSGERAAAPGPGGIDHRQTMWRAELSYRGSFVAGRGFEPFSDNGFLPQVSLTASRTLFVSGPFSFAPGLAWDRGTSTSTARGDATSLAVDRLTVPLEGRVHLGSWGYAFVRGAPGAALQRAEVDDASSPSPLVASRWVFVADASAGYDWLLWSAREPESPGVRVWVHGEGGYGWTASQALALAPAGADSDPRKGTGPTLGSLSMTGPFFRLGAAVSF
jgi:hypothetical protein